MPVCVCGHPEDSNVLGGHCRVPACRCEQFEPIPEITGGAVRRSPAGARSGARSSRPNLCGGGPRTHTRHLELNLVVEQFYDLVITTTQFPIAAAVELLATLGRRPELRATEAGRKIVVDRRLASLVEVALARNPATRRRRITVDVADGVVTLEGVTEPERRKSFERYQE